MGLLYIARGAAGVILVRLGGVVHLPNDLSEQFVYHGFALGRRLHERAAPLLCEGLAFAGRHLPLALQVNLVPHQDHRNLLVPEDTHRRTRENTRQKTHAEEAISGFCVLIFSFSTGLKRRSIMLSELGISTFLRLQKVLIAPLTKTFALGMWKSFT